MDNLNFQTPNWVCQKMVELLPDSVKTVLEPTPGAGNLVRALHKYDVIAPLDFWQIKDKRFDAVVMNPPFTPMTLGYSMLFRCMDMTDTVIALMPWLTVINSEKRTNKLIDYGLKEIIHLPRKVFNGARVQCCILVMQKGFSGCTTINFINENV